MDVARLSHLQSSQLPQLIQLEREIDAEISTEDTEEDNEFLPPQRVKPPVAPKPAGLVMRGKKIV